jgi:hypothetical protein
MISVFVTLFTPISLHGIESMGCNIVLVPRSLHQPLAAFGMLALLRPFLWYR